MVQLGNLKIKIAAVAIALFVIACGEEKKTKKEAEKVVQKKPTERPDFNSDTAYAFVQKQVDFGPRVPNTSAHVLAGNYLVSQLKRFDFEVIEQEAQVIAFNNDKLNIKNIIGSYRAQLNSRILLFAHWDSRPFADRDDERQDEPILAANDGASGVGVLLEIARQIQIKQPEFGIDIIFFDAEDYVDSTGTTEHYCLGSQYWGKNLHKMGYSANYGILLDMVGAKDAIFAQESYSMQHASAYMQYVWNIATDLGHDNHFVKRPTRHVGIDDHHRVHQLAKIPSIDIIQYDPSTRTFAPHWHTHDDNMDIIDKETLQAVGETVLATVLSEVN